MMSTAKAVATCDETKSLGAQVADAVTKVYEARKKYEGDKSRNAATPASSMICSGNEGD